MIIRSVNLECVCGITSTLPDHGLPEFALAGRSNVGKSTLINTLVNRKNYAHTSGKPGKTQTINYYNINDGFYIVDLPGYGYAAAGVEVRAQWGTMIENYLHTSRALQAVFLLADIRREPSGDDALMFDWIVQGGFTPIVIATKADKLKRSQVPGGLKMIRTSLAAKSVSGGEITFEVIPFSGPERTGRDEILAKMEQLLL